MSMYFHLKGMGGLNFGFLNLIVIIIVCNCKNALIGLNLIFN